MKETKDKGDFRVDKGRIDIVGTGCGYESNGGWWGRLSRVSTRELGRIKS